MRLEKLQPWGMGFALAAFMFFAPYLYYRYSLEHTKRLRAVVEGRVYRSGCLTGDGFRDFLTTHKIKTVINLWDESPDPLLAANRFNSASVKESELCKNLGVNFKYIFVELVPEKDIGKAPLKAIDQFRAIMDDEKSYPVLIHCKAGLHRTGVLTAIYRMEYNGWSREDALRELKSHGFGHFIANATNPYILQYVLNYQPRSKSTPSGDGKSATAAAGNATARPIEGNLTSRPK